MSMYLGFAFGCWGSAGRTRWSDGGGLKRIRRVPGSVWGSVLSAAFRVVGWLFERMRDEVLGWPCVWASRRSLFERAAARWSRRLRLMVWKRAMA